MDIHTAESAVPDEPWVHDTLSVPGHQVTPEEFLDMEEAGRYELVDGRLVERHMGEEAVWIEKEILYLIESFLRSIVDGPPGTAYPSGLGYRVFGEKDTKFADVSFIGADRRDPRRPVRRGWTTVVPELVVEVVSPHDKADDVNGKVDLWLGVGVAEVWVVFPVQRVIDRHRPGNQVSRFGDGDEVSGSGTLEGLRIAVSDVLPEPVGPEVAPDGDQP